MDDIPGNSPLHDDFSHLNADMLHTVLELVSDGIWDWNANTGFVYRNPGWYEMLGYPRHSLDNNVFTWENVIHPEDYPQVMTRFDDYINRRAPHYQIEYRCRKQDGSYLWIEDRGYVIARNADGSVARINSSSRWASCITVSASAVVPPGLVTWIRSSSGVFSDWASNSLAPRKVPCTMMSACSRVNPFASAASVSASISRKT